MSLSNVFNQTSANRYDEKRAGKQRVKKPAPFSLRLSKDERARLMAEAKGAPLGAYIKAKVFGNALPMQIRRSGLAVEDRRALAQALAMLGRSRLSSNLNQLAYAANIGTLPVDPDTMSELKTALADVRDLRRLLMSALGMKPEEAI